MAAWEDTVPSRGGGSGGSGHNHPELLRQDVYEARHAAVIDVVDRIDRAHREALASLGESLREQKAEYRSGLSSIAERMDKEAEDRVAERRAIRLMFVGAITSAVGALVVSLVLAGLARPG